MQAMPHQKHRRPKHIPEPDLAHIERINEIGCKSYMMHCLWEVPSLGHQKPRDPDA